MSMIRAVIDSVRGVRMQSVTDVAGASYVPTRVERREAITASIVQRILTIGDRRLSRAVAKGDRREVYCRLRHIATSYPNVERCGSVFKPEQIELAKKILSKRPFEDVVWQMMRERLAGESRYSY